MNIYDFDKTIYRSDSTKDFYFFCLKRHPEILKKAPLLVWAFILYMLTIYTKTQFKEKMYTFLTCINDIDREINDFWDLHYENIKDYYKEKYNEDDLVISASPYFLVKEGCKRIGIKNVIASNVDKNTGRYTGENCWGEEKVKRFKSEYPNTECSEFYSDSLSDTPLAEIAEKAYIVDGEKLVEWKKYKPSLAKKFVSTFFAPQFVMFVVVGVINTFAGTIFSIIYRSFIQNDTAAFIPGYITANVLSYVLNSILTFKESFGIGKYVRFFISCIPNFLIQTIIVALLSGRVPSIVSYCLAAIIGVPVTFVLVKIFAFGKVKKN